MEIRVNTNISKDHGDDIEVCITASKITKELEELVELINEASNADLTTILGYNNNKVSIINIDDIYYVYSADHNNYCVTPKGTFKIKEKLYDLENRLPKKDFIRISNSSIINIKYVDCFDVGVIGTIEVQFIDKSVQYVSRRNVKNVMTFLKERR